MATLKIRWERLISEGQTCPRCQGTEAQLEEANRTLRQALAPLGVDVEVEKVPLSPEEFARDPLRSNRILVNDEPLEHWLGGQTGQSPCCDVCGPAECRTLERNGEMHEVIPADLIVEAGLLAALGRAPYRAAASCCSPSAAEPAGGGCCSCSC
ncbi:MAG: DUF2703 domain-containing protein [Anaerolineae bacterium]|nr:DUF2703 domain-containing protein [Anaerolineae bacterium]